MLFPALGDQRGERIRKQETEQRGQQRVPDRLQKYLGVYRIGEEAHIAVEVEINISVLDQGAKPTELAGRAE